MNPTHARAAAAQQLMQRNRELLLQAFPAQPPGRVGFPRSATFRWLAARLSGKALVSTLLSAAVLRPSWMRLLGLLLMRRRGR